MKRKVVLLGLCLFSFVSAFAQQPIDAATKEDVEEMLQVTGARQNLQAMWDNMATQAASMAAENYQRKHPDATPLDIRKAAELAGESAQQSIKVISIEEIFDVMVPIYQRHLTHSDMRNIIEYYNSPTGQKVVKLMPVMMSESMQAARPIMEKHLSEMEAQAEAAAGKAGKPGDAPSK